MSKALTFEFDKVSLKKSVYSPRAHADYETDQSNDGTVPLTSQQNNLTLISELQIPNVLHSPGTRLFGLTGATVLDSSTVRNLVISLLNTPVTSSTYFVDLNP